MFHSSWFLTLALGTQSTHHQRADLDLLILCGLVDLLEKRHTIGDDESGPAEFSGGMDESLHSHQLVHLALRATQSHHHLHHTFHTQQLIAQVKGPLQDARHCLDGIYILVHVLGIKLAPKTEDKGGQPKEVQSMEWGKV